MTNSDKNGLSPKQLKALPILVSMSNCDAACKSAGISRNCFYEWKKQPLFKAELERLRNEMLHEAIDYLKSNSIKAAETLVGLTAQTDNPTVQRAAANDILNHVMKFKDMVEFEQRMKDLEKRFP